MNSTTEYRFSREAGKRPWLPFVPRGTPSAPTSQSPAAHREDSSTHPRPCLLQTIHLPVKVMRQLGIRSFRADIHGEVELTMEGIKQVGWGAPVLLRGEFGCWI